MNWLGLVVFVAVAIFAVSQCVMLVRDIKARRKNKSAAREQKTDDLKGE